MILEVEGRKIGHDWRGDGLPVVLLHAFPLDRRMWDDQVLAFSDHFRVITIDQRGFGDSHLTRPDYTLGDAAHDVASVLDSLDVKAAAILGLSMGGYVALALFRLYPDRFRALVLADTRAAADTDEGRARRFASAERAEREGAAIIADDMVKLALAEDTLARRKDVVRTMREIIESNQPAGIAAAQRAMADREDSTGLLAEIKCPTLVIVGAEDTLSPVSEAEQMRARIPGATLRVIEGAGHMTNMEQPAEFNEAVIEFLNPIAGTVE